MEPDPRTDSHRLRASRAGPPARTPDPRPEPRSTGRTPRHIGFPRRRLGSDRAARRRDRRRRARDPLKPRPHSSAPPARRRRAEADQQRSTRCQPEHHAPNRDRQARSPPPQHAHRPPPAARAHDLRLTQDDLANPHAARTLRRRSHLHADGSNAAALDHARQQPIACDYLVAPNHIDPQPRVRTERGARRWILPKFMKGHP